jgi:oxygen-independent coproporphyrinogen-3 oxidase
MNVKDEMLASLHKEISLQKNYLPKQPLQSIYFGGGTPSLLSGDKIKKLKVVKNN